MDPQTAEERRAGVIALIDRLTPAADEGEDIPVGDTGDDVA